MQLSKRCQQLFTYNVYLFTIFSRCIAMNQSAKKGWINKLARIADYKRAIVQIIKII